MIKKKIWIILYICITSAYISFAKNVNSADVAPYVFPNNIAQSPIEFSYMPDGKSYLSLSKDGKMIFQYDTEKGQVIDTIINVDATREHTIKNISGFTISPNGTKLLIYNNKKLVNRFMKG